MLEPDTKDWTWVLERRCPECGFDASDCVSESVPELLRQNAERWRVLLEEGAIRPGRPDPSTWSSLEYACHVRDVYTRFDARIALMVTEDDPLFPNWDQDASALEDRYEEQDPAGVIESLETAASALIDRLEGLTATDWPRPGRRSDGSSFTVATIVRYMIHDPVHHLWDVTPA
jgi:DinB superfamily